RHKRTFRQQIEAAKNGSSRNPRLREPWFEGLQLAPEVLILSFQHGNLSRLLLVDDLELGYLVALNLDRLQHGSERQAGVRIARIPWANRLLLERGHTNLQVLDHSVQLLDCPDDR